MRHILAGVCTAIWALFIVTILGLSSCAPVTSQKILATAPASDVIWRGDAETGDISQWCASHMAAPDRVSVVTSPVTQGNYAYKFILNDGDAPTGERVTLAQGLGGCTSNNISRWETGERYYGWSVMLPDGYPMSSLWSLVVQWKGVHSGSPVIQLGQRNGNWQLGVRPLINGSTSVKWKTPTVTGRYENFVMHVNWAKDNTGFIELWYNGVLVVPKFNTPTIHVSGGDEVPVFVAMGLYRDSGISSNVILYHDGFTVGKTYESVTGILPPPVTVSPTVTRTPTPTRTITPTFTPVLTLTPVVVPTVCAPVTLGGHRYNLCTAP